MNEDLDVGENAMAKNPRMNERMNESMDWCGEKRVNEKPNEGHLV